MDKLKLSIIVPVYNAENYIEQCLQSIMRQKTERMEVVLIDDGSSDMSGEICDRYAENYRRMKVIHQKNQGLLESRKKGIEIAEAEYVTFVDSDDWVEGDLFGEFVRIAEDTESVDLVVSGLMCDKGSVSFRKSGSIPPGIYDVKSDDICGRMLYSWADGEMGIAGYACGKLFRRDLLAEIIKGIDEGLVHGEDYAWFYSYVPLARKIVITDQFLYHYRMHSESMSNSFDMNSLDQLLALKNYFNKWMKRQGMSQKNQAGINQLVWGGLMHALREIYGLSVGYIFPYELVKPGSRIVIYGAGVVGRCYYNCLKSGNYASVEAMADKNSSGMAESDCRIISPQRLSETAYDIIVIAVESEELSRSIREELWNLGIEDKKIIWSKPRILCT